MVNDLVNNSQSNRFKQIVFQNLQNLVLISLPSRAKHVISRRVPAGTVAHRVALSRSCQPLLARVASPDCDQCYARLLNAT